MILLKNCSPSLPPSLDYIIIAIMCLPPEKKLSQLSERFFLKNKDMYPEIYIFYKSNNWRDIISLYYSNTIYVCLKLISSGTDGSIWIIIFLLAMSWWGEGFKQKNMDLGSGFFRKQEKLNFKLSILADFSAFNFLLFFIM